MAELKVGKFTLDPAKCPAVLDTTTWDRAAAVAQVVSAGTGFWDRIAGAPGSAADPGLRPHGPGCMVHPGSHSCVRGEDIVLVSLPDGQDVLARFTAGGASPLGRPLAAVALSGGRKLAVHPTDMPVLQRYLQRGLPEKAPRALGSMPRLGIGDRHTVAVWPAAFRAMERGGFAANAIQNSLRELNLLDDLKQGIPPRENYLFSFGRIAEGHTGSTFEGLLHAGIIAALKAPTIPRYGADADHIQVKRGPGGLARARQVVEASRYYSFFTLDVSDVLDYGALKTGGDPEALSLLAAAVPDEALRRDVLACHGRARTVAGRSYSFNEAEVGRFAGKYGNALGAVEALCAHLAALKAGVPFDVELSIDENPSDVPTADCTTTVEEMVFLSTELQRRHLPVTHIAPNFGVEKGTDYRGPDGREGLERRVRAISEIAEDRGLMLDCHSGDDLLPETRRVFGRASRGRINFKISPQLQIMFAETLADVQNDLFRYWWNDVEAFVREEATRGSPFAAECLEELKGGVPPSPGARLFHAYCFVSVGRREAGRFVNRERLYDLSERTRDEYGRRLEAWLAEIAEDLYGQR